MTELSAQGITTGQKLGVGWTTSTFSSGAVTLLLNAHGCVIEGLWTEFIYWVSWEPLSAPGDHPCIPFPSSKKAVGKIRILYLSWFKFPLPGKATCLKVSTGQVSPHFSSAPQRKISPPPSQLIQDLN